MPLSLTKPTIGGDDGVWGPPLNGDLDAIETWANAEEQARLDLQASVPTIDAMNAAIAAAVAQPILGF